MNGPRERSTAGGALISVPLLSGGTLLSLAHQRESDPRQHHPNHPQPTV